MAMNTKNTIPDRCKVMSTFGHNVHENTETEKTDWRTTAVKILLSAYIKRGLPSLILKTTNLQKSRKWIENGDSQQKTTLFQGSS